MVSDVQVLLLVGASLVDRHKEVGVIHCFFQIDHAEPDVSLVFLLLQPATNSDSLVPWEGDFKLLPPPQFLPW